MSSTSSRSSVVTAAAVGVAAGALLVGAAWYGRSRRRAAAAAAAAGEEKKTAAAPAPAPAPAPASATSAAAPAPLTAEAKTTAAAAAAAAVSAGPRIHVDLLVHALAIVPMETPLPTDRPASASDPSLVLHNHTLVVDQGLIVALLPHAEALAKYSATEIVDQSSTGVLIPGFVNMHAHLGMTLMRGYSDDVCLVDWLKDHIWPGEAEFVSAEFVRDGTELGIAEMIRGGTTCFNDMYFFPEEATALVDKIGLRACISQVILEFPTPYAAGASEYIEKGLKLRARYPRHPRIQFSFGPHAPYSVGESTWERVRDLAKEHKTTIHTHLHETKEEVEDSEFGRPSFARHQSERKITPFANFTRMGLIEENLIAAHMTQLTDDNIKILADNKANVVHMSSSNLKLACGFCPVAKLQRAGVNVCIGTDSSASNNKLDMFQEIRTASLLAKGVARDAAACPAYETLRMATINGARALGIGHLTGSLVPGKSADVVSISVDCLDMLPMYDVLSHLVFCASRERVTDVWVLGRRLLKAGELTTINETAVKANALRWGAKLTAFREKRAVALLAAKLAPPHTPKPSTPSPAIW